MKKLNYLTLFLGIAGIIGQGYMLITGHKDAFPWLLVAILVTSNAIEYLEREGW